MIRYTYAYGYRSHAAAVEAIESMFAAGEISPSERPQAKRYIGAVSGRALWCITLESTS